MVGLRLSGKAPDREHPYGHERMECVAAIVLAGVLLVTGLLIGYSGAKEILTGQAGDRPVPGVMALVAAMTVEPMLGSGRAPELPPLGAIAL